MQHHQGYLTAKPLAGAAAPRTPRALLRGLVAMVPPLARSRNRRRLLQRMRASLGYEPDLRRPRTFNERMARKILDDRDPRIPLTLDKFAVRAWVSERIGAGFLIPLHGVWDRPEDIPWDRLPDRFVLKANHGCGYNVLVTDKNAVDRDAVSAQLRNWLNERYDEVTGEWGYRNIRPRLLAEEFLSDGEGDVPPADFKLYVFGGRVRMLQVHLDRFSRHRQLWFDPRTLQPLEFGPTRHREFPDFVMPPQAGGLADLAEALGAGFASVRVDFFLVGGQTFFGEVTQYSGGGCVPLGDKGEDLALGNMWGEAIVAA